jgi:cytochrome bd-type quinol oxidase subunit 2
MSVDNLFKAIERRTEQDLYRMSFRAVATTQRELVEQIEANRKAMQRKRIATEVLWFFGAALIGLLLGYIANETLTAVAPALRQQLAGFWFKKDVNVFYFLSALGFLGVYVVRMTIWALRML